MNSKYDYDIIRDYLHGLVDQDTARRMRDLIRDDEVARTIAAGILQLEHEFNGNEGEVESYIEGLRLKQMKLINVQGRSRSIRAWTKLAAVLLVLVVAGAGVRLFMSVTDPLKDELDEPYPLVTVDRGTIQSDGYRFYQEGNYKDAIAAFDQSPYDVNAVFYNGLSNLYAGNYDRAVELLGSIYESRYRDQASWYRALALLKWGKAAEARAALEKIATNPDHYKTKTAQDLSADLY